MENPSDKNNTNLAPAILSIIVKRYKKEYP